MARNTVSESEFQAAVLKAVGGQRPDDVRVWRQLTGNLYAKYGPNDYRPISLGPPKGAADISGLLLRSGRRLELELKSASGRLRPEQFAFGENMRRWNAVHLVATYDSDLTLEQNVAYVLDAVDEAVRDDAVIATDAASRRIEALEARVRELEQALRVFTPGA